MTDWGWTRPKTWGDMYGFIQHQRSENHKERKAILAFCGCCRITWELTLLECNRRAIEASERYADGLATLQELETCWKETKFEPHIYTDWICSAAGPCDGTGTDNLCPTTDEDHEMVARFHVNFPDDVRAQWSIQSVAIGLDVFGYLFNDCELSPSCLSSTAIAIAHGIYDERAFDRLPILADALQDAGCENEDILKHLRGDGPHVRGCWALDLVLGKS